MLSLPRSSNANRRASRRGLRQTAHGRAGDRLTTTETVLNRGERLGRMSPLSAEIPQGYLCHCFHADRHRVFVDIEFRMVVAPNEALFGVSTSNEPEAPGN